MEILRYGEGKYCPEKKVKEDLHLGLNYDVRVPGDVLHVIRASSVFPSDTLQDLLHM